MLLIRTSFDWGQWVLKIVILIVSKNLTLSSSLILVTLYEKQNTNSKLKTIKSNGSLSTPDNINFKYY